MPTSPTPSPLSFTLANIDAVGPDVVRLTLAGEAGRFRYREGQFLSLHLAEGIERSYSMASPDAGNGEVELHVHLVPGGRFSRWLRAADRTGETLAVSGPFGHCTWQTPPDDDTPVVMLATGTGIAPLKALLEATLQEGAPQPVTLYWGGRRAGDLYLADDFTALAARHPRFRFVPVLADPGPGWNGRRGFVQDAAAEDLRDFSDAIVYACGAPRMVEAARERLTGQRGLPDARFHADTFLPAAGAATDPATGRIALHVRQGDHTRTLRVPASGSLMTALAAAGLIRPVCGGQGACGECRVDLAAAQVPPASPRERRLLDALDDPLPTHRLACRIALTPRIDGLAISLPTA
ncbi:NAD(P)H-flavin reductase [Paludibacterium paludis]|nr:FAD-binding oxidoreductase [Paludibacterium paludis]